MPGERVLELYRPSDEELLRGLIHALNGKMGFVSLALELQGLGTDVGGSATLQGTVDDASRLLERVGKLVSLRRGLVPSNPVALETVMGEAAASTSHLHRPDIHVIGGSMGNGLKVPSLVTLALAEVVANAVHASPVGGTVQMEARIESEDLDIQVMDNGKGVSEEDLDQVIRPFYSGEGFVGRGGLGLTMAAEVLEVTNGQLIYATNGEQGAVFTIRFSPEWIEHHA
jgi:two-component system OmpR family sensor kinase